MPPPPFYAMPMQHSPVPAPPSLPMGGGGQLHPAPPLPSPGQKMLELANEARRVGSPSRFTKPAPGSGDKQRRSPFDLQQAPGTKPAPGDAPTSKAASGSSPPVQRHHHLHHHTHSYLAPEPFATGAFLNPFFMAFVEPFWRNHACLALIAGQQAAAGVIGSFPPFQRKPSWWARLFSACYGY